MNPVFRLLWGDTDRAATLAGTLSEHDWKKIDFHAAQHRLRPLLHHRAKSGCWPIPSNIAESWAAGYHRSALRALRQRAELTRIGVKLSNENITALVLKGGAFIWSDGLDAALRPMRDLDLLVAPEHLALAGQILRSIGYTAARDDIDPQAKHLPTLTSNGVHVELHRHIFDIQNAESEKRQASFIARCWIRSVPSATPNVLAFCSTDIALHLIWHAVLDNQFNNGPLLLTDLQILTACHDFDWSLFWEEAQRLDIVRPCQLALRVGEDIARIKVDWDRFLPVDLPDSHIRRVTKLMLVNMEQRSSLGWPGQLARLRFQQWPGAFWKMLYRRKKRVSAMNGSTSPNSWWTPLNDMFGPIGRAHIADAISVGRWLRRE